LVLHNMAANPYLKLENIKLCGKEGFRRECYGILASSYGLKNFCLQVFHCVTWWLLSAHVFLLYKEIFCNNLCCKRVLIEADRQFQQHYTGCNFFYVYLL